MNRWDEVGKRLFVTALALIFIYALILAVCQMTKEAFTG